MDMKKVLVLLSVLIIYTNYENYFKPDISKLHRQIATLKTNIKREIQIQKDDHTKESLFINYNNVTFNGNKYSYSKAMGAMQNQINEAAKDVCTVNRITWAQVPTKKEWYDRLKMNLSIFCKPKDLLTFTNRLKDKKTIYRIENFRVTKDIKKAILRLNIQLVAYRVHK